ncbi:MAG: hypothetical protein AVDCRST_MAG69-2611, partial [uncultured Solirubrobacteraceae bacterium]
RAAARARAAARRDLDQPAGRGPPGTARAGRDRRRDRPRGTRRPGDRLRPPAAVVRDRRRGRSAVPDPDRGRRRDGEPARPALRGHRRRSARLDRPPPARTCARGGARAAIGMAGVAADRLRRRLRRPVRLFRVAVARAVPGRLLLRAVHPALRAPALPGLDATADRAVLRRAGGARPGVRGDRLRGVPDAPSAAQSQGDRLQPDRGVLPGQLAVLRSQHLRALPRRGDARRHVGPPVDALFTSHPQRHRGAGGPRGRPAADPVAIELRLAAGRLGGAGAAALARALDAAGGRTGGGSRRGAAGRRPRPGRLRRLRPRVARRGELRAPRADRRRPAARRAPPGAGRGLGLLRVRVPPAGGRLECACDRRLPHHPGHRRRRAGTRGPRNLSRPARRRPAPAAARRPPWSGACGGGRGLRRPRRAHLDVRRVPGGSDDLGAARRRRRAGAKGRFRLETGAGSGGGSGQDPPPGGNGRRV